ncbi:MAG: hypothetical protein IKH20_04825 [Clostridiales bacterium]|nr:hypothetical protein [Clostridiales bacterium]
MTRWQFFKSDEARGMRTNLIASSGCCFALAVFSLVANVIKAQEPLSLIDVGFMVIIGLLILFLQSRAAAVILAIYAGFNIYAFWDMNGKPEYGSFIVVIVAVYALIYTFRFQKAWKEKKNAQKEASKEATEPVEEP